MPQNQIISTENTENEAPITECGVKRKHDAPHTRSQGAVSADFKTPEKPRIRSGSIFSAYLDGSPGSKPALLPVFFSPGGSSATSSHPLSPIVSMSSPNALGVPKRIKTGSRTLHHQQSSLNSSVTGHLFSEKAPDKRESKPQSSDASASVSAIIKTVQYTVCVDYETIDFMARYNRHNQGHRYPQQKAFFDKKPATETAAQFGYSNEIGENWQYCHIIAHSLGGLSGDNIIQLNQNNYHKTTLVGSPQARDNLFIGTTACNGQMLVIENIVKFLLKTGRASSVNIEVEVDYDTQDGDIIPMATELRYRITAKNNEIICFDDTYTFRAKSLHKPLRSYPDYLKRDIEAFLASEAAEEAGISLRPS